MIEKIKIDAYRLQQDSTKIGMQIIHSGFDPEYCVMVATGGAQVFPYVVRALNRNRKLRSCDPEKYSEGFFKASSYNDMNQGEIIRIRHMDSLMNDIRESGSKRIVVVDEITDTQRTRDFTEHVFMKGLSRRDSVKSFDIQSRPDKKRYIFSMDHGMREYLAEIILGSDIEPIQNCDIRFATPYWKENAKNRVRSDAPDFYVGPSLMPDGEGNHKWLVFPSEYDDFPDDADLANNFPEVAHIILDKKA